MFTRVTVVQGSPENADRAVAAIQDQAAPAVRQIPGLTGAYWGVDRATGKAISFTIFDTEESMRASDEMASEIRERAVAAAGAQILSVDTYEVVAQI